MTPFSTLSDDVQTWVQLFQLREEEIYFEGRSTPRLKSDDNEHGPSSQQGKCVRLVVFQSTCTVAVLHSVDNRIYKLYRHNRIILYPNVKSIRIEETSFGIFTIPLW